MGRTGLRTVNVIGTTPGEARRPRVLLGAHLDSFRAPGCPGANDNASGVGVLLEVARVVARDKLPCAVQFAFFGGEEQWAQHGSRFGSRHYVAAQGPGAPPLLAMISVDMVGRGERIYGWETGNEETYLGALLARSATRLGLPLVTKRGRLNSDHAPFAGAGVPSMWLQRLPDPAYHSVRDGAGNLQRQCLSESGRLLVHLLRSLEPEDVALLEAERFGRKARAQ